jgi:hypothetical protein
MLQTMKRTIDDWTSIFATYLDKPATSALGSTASDPITKVALKTPAKLSNFSTATTDLMVYSPRGIRQLLHDDHDNSSSWLQDLPTVLPTDFFDFLRNVHTFLTDFDHWWKTPLSDTYTSMATIKDDLYTLKQYCEKLHIIVGQPTTIFGMDFPDV